MQLPDGLVAVVKKDCPTCLLVEPVLQAIEKDGLTLTVYVQDEPSFPDVGTVVDDTALECSYNLEIEIVPTLIKVENGTEQNRTIGWVREEWQELTGLSALGSKLPEFRPGCGSISVEPGVAERLALRFGDFDVVSRRIEVGGMEDDIEYCFDRGWSDGLPVVPPTEERLYRMLQGTSRAPNEVLGEAPPDLATCTVEKVALNAVLAGCKPEYLPVVIAAVEAALDPAFCMH
ncbi:MAG TPA: thioredoxin, partial [Sneathiellales bacterium]|nr:thioredoxin [Sneathiellales bacterium]